MRPLLAFLAVVVLTVGLASIGCSPAVPPAPTAVPAVPTKVPAAAPAAPTQAAAPAAKIAWPEKGKTITIIVPMAAGGGTDIAARAIAVPMEKDLGVPIQIVNKPGGGTQTGQTEIAASKPDGYTIGVVNHPTGMLSYLDTTRGATYDRKSFQTIGMISSDPIGLNVRADSPIKTVKDVVDTLKANPGSLSSSTTGLGSVNHLAGMRFEDVAGVKITYVQTPGTPESLTALMGGHVQMMLSGVSGLPAQLKSGEARQLAVFAKVPNPLAPAGVPTFESQGYPVYAEATFGMVVPAGTPKEIVARLEEVFKKGMADEAVKQKLLSLGQIPQGLGAEEYGKAWDEMEEWVKPLVAKFRQ